MTSRFPITLSGCEELPRLIRIVQVPGSCNYEWLKIKSFETPCFDPLCLNITFDITGELNGDMLCMNFANIG